MPKQITKLVLAVIALPIHFSAIAAPSEDQLMIAASTVNISEAIAHECETMAPDYWRVYEVNLKALTKEVLEPMGITAAMRKKAAQVPEVAPPQYVKDFKSNAVEERLKTCLKLLIDIQGGLIRARQNAQP